MPREIPYRGDGNPRNIKPRRRFRNFKKERREILVSIIIVLVLFLIPFSLFILDDSLYNDNTINIVALVIGSLFVLTLLVGILSINKFRKGYDVDVSEEADKDDDIKSEDPRNED